MRSTISSNHRAGVNHRKAIVLTILLTLITSTVASHGRAIAAAAGTPTMTYAAAARFLEQATFGPTAADITALQQAGIAAWFAQQQTAAESTYPPAPTPTPTSAGPTPTATPGAGVGISFAQARFLYNAMNGADQLRQRMAFALGQIWVISGLKIRVDGMEPYLQLLQDKAFANYRTVMGAVTLNPSMGRYLDMVNNAKANPTRNTLPNENYAREFLQLFTIGTIMLNSNGTPQLDSHGNPIPTYQQADIQNLARVFTGWTYAPLPGQVSKWTNPQNFAAPMVAVEQQHDTAAKTVLGHTLAAGQTAEQDLAQTLDLVFNHPNVPPFVALRLIEHFVTSNPSPSYVGRVAQVFQNNGSGVRGDLFAVIRAVLTDSEAREGDKNPSLQPPTGGHLREPVLYATCVLRALGATVAATNNLAGPIATMGQALLLPPSVFNYYSPFYRIPGAGLAGPEFQLLTPSTATLRANFVNSAVFGYAGSGVTIDLTPFVNAAGNIGALIGAVDLAFTRGQMPASMKNTIATALAATNDLQTRARNAVYLAATSGLYQVEH